MLKEEQSMKKVMAIAIAAAVVLSTAAVSAIAVDTTKQMSRAARISENKIEISEGVSIRVIGNTIQFIKDGEVIRTETMKTKEITLTRSENGGITIQFKNIEGKMVRVSLGAQKAVSIDGKLNKLTLGKNMPSSAYVEIATGSTIKTLVVSSDADVSIENGTKIENMKVTTSSARIDVASGAFVTNVEAPKGTNITGVKITTMTVGSTDRETDTSNKKDDNKENNNNSGGSIVIKPTPPSDPEPGNPTPPPPDPSIKQVSTQEEFEAALKDPTIKTITLSGTEAFKVPTGGTETGKTINAPSGTTLKDYWNVGEGNKVVASAGANLKWDNTDDTEGTLFGTGGNIILSDGSMTITGKANGKSDYTISGNGSLNAVGNEGSLVVKPGESLIIDTGSQVTVKPKPADGNTTDNTWPTVNVHSDGGKLIVKGELILDEGALVVLGKGKESIEKPEGGTVTDPNKGRFDPSDIDTVVGIIDGKYEEVTDYSLREAAASEKDKPTTQGTAQTPEAAPVTPETKPEVPEAKPEAPETKPETPEAKPEVPEAKPEVPEAKPETPETKPETPETKPETPEPTPSPEAPTPTPTPEAPAETPAPATPEAPIPVS